METQYITGQLQKNSSVFQGLLENISEAGYLWKQSPDKWCLLEIVCHLYDEEREDFRARVKHTLETPEQAMPPIDPVGWVHNRHYIDKNYKQMLDDFLTEREQSVEWLRNLSLPKWDSISQHPTFGPMTAKMFLANWLAHDYHHFRQITRLKYDYLNMDFGEELDYAGKW